MVPEKYHAYIDKTLLENGYDVPVIWSLEGIEDPLYSIASRLLSFAEGTVKRTREGREVSQEIYVAVVADDEFQAAALPLPDGAYCILIWARVWMDCLLAPRHLIGTPTFASFFETDQTDHAVSVPEGITSSTAFHDYLMKSSCDAMTDDNDSASILVSYAMIEWLVLHELGHIINGHVRGVTTLTTARFIIERVPGHIDHDENITWQTLEFDADAFATQHLMIFAKLAEQPFAEKLRKSEKHGGAAWALLASVVVSLIGKFLEYEVDYERELFVADHPWGELRAIMSLTTALEVLNQHPWNIPYEKGIEIAGPAVLLADRAIFDVTGRRPDKKLIKVLDVRDGYMDVILKRWAKIRPSLVPHHLGKGNLAPAQRDPA